MKITLLEVMASTNDELNVLLEKVLVFKDLKKHQKPLTKDERAEVKKLKAEWSDQRSAIWKSVHPKTGKTTWITNTHRAMNTAPTLKGAASRFHKFIKGTA